ncbi:TetR family transcriptional regulator [Pelagibius litoralis]|uniref:TetR family transcriptional regulator n=1 Tax=Pelagibius litoralis TaxID=374515 RepID=A0A967KI49_9PROT|nr:TetR family transcriptional regulator [Pelagibius litoralis]NIA71926.1 TetR family transcriptional regulator [Pelagibius litoralis]
MVKKADLPKHIIDTAFALAAERGWRDLSLAEIAAAAKVPLSTLYPLFSSKQAIIEGFADHVDAAVMADEDREGAETPARDRLFDVLMQRFEAMQPQREAIGAILQDQLRDPLSICCGMGRLMRSMATTLEAAGFSTTGLRGLLRIKGISAVYLSTLRVWLRDESEDMAKTMAFLDKQLQRADSLAGRMSGCTMSGGMKRAAG